MRCKPGDVAVITKKIPENVGRLVLVVEYFGEVDYPHLDLWKLPCWLVETMGGPLKSETGEFICVGNIPDLALRPIGQSKLTRAELPRARAEAELKAAWENLAEVARTAAREQEAEAEAAVEKEA